MCNGKARRYTSLPAGPGAMLRRWKTCRLPATSGRGRARAPNRGVRARRRRARPRPSSTGASRPGCASTGSAPARRAGCRRPHATGDDDDDRETARRRAPGTRARGLVRVRRVPDGRARLGVAVTRGARSSAAVRRGSGDRRRFDRTPARPRPGPAECLDRLSERERTVLLLTFYEDKQAAEVAARARLNGGQRAHNPASRPEAPARLRDRAIDAMTASAAPLRSNSRRSSSTGWASSTTRRSAYRRALPRLRRVQREPARAGRAGRRDPHCPARCRARRATGGFVHDWPRRGFSCVSMR